MIWIFYGICGFFLLGYLWLIRYIKKGIEKLKLPKWDLDISAISVIVCAKNEEDHIRRVVQEILHQDTPIKLEVIVVDDHSTDHTAQLVNSMLDDFPSLKLVTNQGSGKKQAIESGVFNASYQWILMTDADVVIGNQWVNSIVQYVASSTKLVLGPVGIVSNSAFLNTYQEIEFNGLQASTAGAVGNNHPIMANGANMLFEKQTFWEADAFQGNYDKPTGDDVYLLNAIKQKFPEGVSFAWSYSAMVTTYGATSWDGFLNQRVRWASKSDAILGYKNRAISVIVVGQALIGWVLLMVSAVGQKTYIWWLFVVIKFLADWWLISFSDPILRKKYPVWKMFVFSVTYPLVILISGVWGMLKPPKRYQKNR